MRQNALRKADFCEADEERGGGGVKSSRPDKLIFHSSSKEALAFAHMGFWNDVCQDTVSRSRADKIIAINTSSYAVLNLYLLLHSILTSFLQLPLLTLHPSSLQIGVFFVCGMAAGTMAWRFRLFSHATPSRLHSTVWKDYGLFWFCVKVLRLDRVTEDSKESRHGRRKSLCKECKPKLPLPLAEQIAAVQAANLEHYPPIQQKSRRWSPPTSVLLW